MVHGDRKLATRFTCNGSIRVHKSMCFSSSFSFLILCDLSLPFQALFRTHRSSVFGEESIVFFFLVESTFFQLERVSKVITLLDREAQTTPSNVYYGNTTGHANGSSGGSVDTSLLTEG